MWRFKHNSFLVKYGFGNCSHGWSQCAEWSITKVRYSYALFDYFRILFFMNAIKCHSPMITFLLKSVSSRRGKNWRWNSWIWDRKAWFILWWCNHSSKKTKRKINDHPSCYCTSIHSLPHLPSHGGGVSTHLPAQHLEGMVSILWWERKIYDAGFTAHISQFTLSISYPKLVCELYNLLRSR